MSYEDYANHISQKLKLAVSIAIIRSKPENITTDEYINQLKSNILHQMDSDSEISVCSDDFQLDDSISDHNTTNNNNISDNNHHSDNNPINSTNLSDNYNEGSMNDSTGDNIKHGFDNNNEIDNITLINVTQAVTVTRNEEYNRNCKINDRENDYIGIDEETNDIFINSNNILLANEDYNNLIDEVLELDESQTILNNFGVYDIDNSDRGNNFNNNRDTNVKYRKMSAQDICATQTIDFTQSLDFNDETHYQSSKDTSTQTTTKSYQKLSNSDTKGNEDDGCTIMHVINTKTSDSKHDFDIEDGPSPKRKKNVDTDLILQQDRQIEDPTSRIKNNISKFLEKNNIATKTKVITEDAKVKDSFDTFNKKLDQNSTECTQTNTYYSQSQPPLVIDQKYIYEKSKSMPRIEKVLNLGTELTKKDLSISPSDKNTTNININYIHHNTTDKNPITNETAIEFSNYRTNKKIIENDTEFQFEREIYPFSETLVCDARENNTSNKDIIIESKDHRNDLNNKINATKTEDNNKEDIVNAARYYTKDNRDYFNTNSSIDLTQTLLSPLFEEKNNNENQENNNSNNFNDKETTQYSINLTGDGFSPKQNNNNRNRDNSHINNNNETVQSTVDSFRQQSQLNNINRNRDNNNRNRDNSNRNNEPAQFTIETFSQQNNDNRNIDNNNINRNNHNNGTSTDLTQNTFNNLPKENYQNDEIINQSRNSDADLTDSDEVRTEEVIPFKIVEELNKVKVYLNKIERVSDNSSDAGYKSDSQSRHSLKMSQSNVWLNQSAHSLFTYISSCPLILNTEEITRDISVVLAQLIQKLHEEENYLSFIEELLDTVDLLLHSVLDENTEENECLKKEQTMQRILLLNKSIHIQKYTIDKITYILENIHTNLTTKDTIYETENIQKIENSCYIFHILHIILQRYYKNQEILTKSKDSSQKSQLDSQKSQFNSQKSQFNSQKSQYSSLSQEVLKKTDISDIWRKKWNPNFKEDKNEENLDKKCALTDCSKVLNKLIVSCMDGYSLIAYFALKCFNLMQSK